MKKVFIPILTMLFVASSISLTVKNIPSAKEGMKKFKNEFSYIPSGSINFDNESLSIQAFYMSKTVVTNGAYQVGS